MTTKYRLVKEIFPDRTRYYTEKYHDGFNMWIFVDGTLTLDDESKARELFARAMELPATAVTEVLAEASVE